MDKWFFYGLAAASILATIVLLVNGPAKGEERPLDAKRTEFEGGVTTYEFTPKSAQAMQCIFVTAAHREGGVFCWPKIMNDQFQTLINRLKEDMR